MHLRGLLGPGMLPPCLALASWETIMIYVLRPWDLFVKGFCYWGMESFRGDCERKHVRHQGSERGKSKRRQEKEASRRRVVIESATLNGQHGKKEDMLLWQSTERKHTLNGKRVEVLSFLSRTRSNSTLLILSFSPLTQGVTMPSLCSAWWELNAYFLTRPSRLVFQFDSNVHISKTVRGSEVLQDILHVVYTSRSSSEMKTET